MTAPILLWLRRDLRLADHPACAEAAATGRAVIPVFVLDPLVETYGAAPKWRLGAGLAQFAETLAAMGSRLILRRGPALESLAALAAETGARDIWWSRAYDPAAVARDTDVKAGLKAQGLGARSFPGHLLFEPWEVSTKEGGFYKVYTPFWRAVQARAVADPTPAPARLPPPERWPASENLADWALGAAMHRGAAVVARHGCIGEAAAQARLARFLDGPVARYKTRRDLPAAEATSNLSENLAWGEIAPARIWHAAARARHEGVGAEQGAETFLKELVWREFAYHLAFHTPRIVSENWRAEWDSFPWRCDDGPEVLRWKQGRTGQPFVDAAMRELYVTGRMHNRARMIVASYLTKHMLTHWRIGQRWFEETLTDWDPAANAMGWQWVAGSGPDAAPYFRIFNPETQAAKFDPEGAYIRRFLAEQSRAPGAEALAFFDACPRAWGLAPEMGAPAPLVDLKAGRARALAAYAARG